MANARKVHSDRVEAPTYSMSAPKELEKAEKGEQVEVRQKCKMQLGKIRSGTSVVAPGAGARTTGRKSAQQPKTWTAAHHVKSPKEMARERGGMAASLEDEQGGNDNDEPTTEED